MVSKQKGFLETTGASFGGWARDVTSRGGSAENSREQDPDALSHWNPHRTPKLSWHPLGSACPLVEGSRELSTSSQ
jgi:hypothetical protein